MTAHQKTLRESGFCSLPCFFFPLFTVLSVCIGCRSALRAVTPLGKRRSGLCRSARRAAGAGPPPAFLLLRKQEVGGWGSWAGGVKASLHVFVVTVAPVPLILQGAAWKEQNPDSCSYPRSGSLLESGIFFTDFSRVLNWGSVLLTPSLYTYLESRLAQYLWSRLRARMLPCE